MTRSKGRKTEIDDCSLSCFSLYHRFVTQCQIPEKLVITRLNLINLASHWSSYEYPIGYWKSDK